MSKWFLIVLFCGLVPVLNAQAKLPDGDGKALVERICTECHGADQIVELKLSEAEWRAEVDKMIARGAEGTDEEFNTIVKYLAKNFGKPAASIHPRFKTVQPAA